MAPNRPQTLIRLDVSVGSNSEVGARNRHVRFPPDSDQTADIAGRPKRANRDSCTAVEGFLFDHLLSGREQHWRDRQAERCSRLQIEVKIEAVRLLHREISRVRSVHDLVEVDRHLSGYFDEIGPKAHQPACYDSFAKGVT